MTETTTPSVEGDRLEAIARIVASSSVDSRAVRSDEVWAAIKPSSREECFDYARQIAALPCKAAPIPMVLFCPACGFQHIDEPDTHDAAAEKLLAGQTPWDNPPHRSHLCHGCGHIWRPADVPTTGVQAVQTKGKADSPALPCKGGEACQNCGSTDTVENLTAGGFVSCCPERKMASTPTTEPDTGRGLREALEALCSLILDFEPPPGNDKGQRMALLTQEARVSIAARQALAALSDTPRGREGEGKQGLMASRDLGPTTVASSLKGSDVGEVGE